MPERLLGSGVEAFLCDDAQQHVVTATRLVPTYVHYTPVHTPVTPMCVKTAGRLLCAYTVPRSVQSPICSIATATVTRGDQTLCPPAPGPPHGGGGAAAGRQRGAGGGGARLPAAQRAARGGGGEAGGAGGAQGPGTWKEAWVGADGSLQPPSVRHAEGVVKGSGGRQRQACITCTMAAPPG